MRYGNGPLRRLEKPTRTVTRKISPNSAGGDAPRPTAEDPGGRQVLGGIDPGSARVSPRPNVRPPTTGVLGSGIVASGYRGHGGVYHGTYNVFSSCYYWSSYWYGGFYNPCYWGAWPYYFACYFPFLYSYYRPYFQTVYVSEPAVENRTTVIYVNGTSNEPTGEAVVPEPLTDRLPIAAERYLTLGDRAFREGRYTDAVQFYAKAVEFAPDQGGLFLVLGDALFAAGDYHYAAYALRRAFELEPALAEATVDKRNFYSDPADFQAQLEALESYLAQHPTDRDARLVLALNYHFSARSEDAKKLLGAGVGLDTDTAALAILGSLK